MLKRWRMTVQGTLDAAFSALLYGISGKTNRNFFLSQETSLEATITVSPTLDTATAHSMILR
jgi:hypothetical protein